MKRTLHALGVVVICALFPVVARGDKDLKANNPLASIERMRAAVRDVEVGPDEKRGPSFQFLAELGPKAKPIVPDLVRLLEKDDEESRRHALSLLGSIGPDAKTAVPALRKTLNHADFHTQYWACRALAKIGPDAKEAVPELLKILPKKSAAASVRRNAALTLGAIGPAVGAEAIGPLGEALFDNVALVREDAAWALGQMGKLADPALPSLEKALKDGASTVRISVAVALWRLTQSTDKTLDVLVAELGTPDAPWEAAKGIGVLGAAAEPAIPRIRQLLQAEDADQRIYAIEALDHIGPAAHVAIPDLRRLLMDKDEDVAETAKETLEKWAAASKEKTK